MASLDNLPTELLVIIAEYVDPPPPPVPFLGPDTSPTAIASLSMVCRRFYVLFTSTLYDRYGHLAVPWACHKPCLDTFKAVLRETSDGESVHARINGPVPLQHVLQNDKLVKIENLDRSDWRKGVDRRVRFNTLASTWSASPLHLACAAGHDDIVNFLLDNGASMETESAMYCECLLPCNYPWTEPGNQIEVPRWLPLHHALCRNHISTALLMLRRGAPVIVSQDAVEDEAPGVTALHMAAAHGQAEVVCALINLWTKHPDSFSPLNPHRVDWGNHCPMHYLALNEKYSSVITLAQIFQNHGINVDHHLGDRSGTAFLLSCHLGNFTAARALIDLGADPHKTDTAGLHCLELVLSAGYMALRSRQQSKTTWERERLQLVKELFKANALSPFPLSDAAHYGHVNEVKLLLDAGISHVDRLDSEGLSPLAVAAREGHVELVEVLLAAGASVTHVKDRTTAAAFCANYEPVTGNHAKILRTLLKHGATVGFCCDSNDMLQRNKDYSGSVLDDTMWRIEGFPRLRHGEGINSSNFSFILKHSTPINFPKACWQQAVFVTLESDDLKLSRAGGFILKKLLWFGTQFGYVFDDPMLCTLVGLLIRKGDPQDLNIFFAMGGPGGVQGETGLVTSKAALFMAMANYRLEVFKWNKPLSVIRYLILQIPLSAGKVRLLGNATLLHLACCTGDPAIINMILVTGKHNLQALWCSVTPLMLAIAQDDVSFDVIRILLDHGADPYFTPGNTSGDVGALHSCPTNQCPDLLDPGNGRTLSSGIRGMLSELTRRHECWASQQFQVPAGRNDNSNVQSVGLDLSVFELAIIKGRPDILMELLRHKPLVEQARKRPTDSPQSYLGLAIMYRQFECFKVLVAAGANINADRECPLLAYQLSELTKKALEQLVCHESTADRQEIDLDWLGKELATLILLVKAGADWKLRSKTFPKSFIDHLREIFKHDMKSSDHKNPSVLVQSVLREAFTIGPLDPKEGPETLNVNLEGTDDWLGPIVCRQAEQWFKWPASWREWKARWSQILLEPSSKAQEVAS
ncbi:ankyrin repeat-containing domain protein [Cladorrhinum sp. PSN259]|nr:ankyrin repeat-containing domain protein [Cladorrhinum sp. PSN259]